MPPGRRPRDSWTNARNDSRSSFSSTSAQSCSGTLPGTGTTFADLRTPRSGRLVDHGVGYDISYDDLVGWEADLRLLTERVAGSLFTRPEPRATLADLVRKNSWQLAEYVGHGSAYRLEWLLGGAKWDADVLRDRVREYVVATLGAEDGVLI